MDVSSALTALAAGFAVLLVAVIVLAVRVGNLTQARRPAGAGENAPEAAPSPAAEEIPEEVVAAIAAAVYCLEPGAAVRSVRRSVRRPAPGDARAAWKTAGLLENTRPF